jgi:hypothetical protein
MWERGLGHGDLQRPCPRPPSSFYISAVRQGPTTICRLVPPIRAQDRTGFGTWFRSVGRPLGSIQQFSHIHVLCLPWFLGTKSLLTPRHETPMGGSLQATYPTSSLEQLLNIGDPGVGHPTSYVQEEGQGHGCRRIILLIHK